METASVKRKHPSTTQSARPSKQARKPSPPPNIYGLGPQQNGQNGLSDSNGETPNGHGGSPYEWDDEPQEMVLAPAPVDTPEWQATLEKVVSNVVSIHFCQTCSFDTDPAMTSEATGFVVDAEKGYIMTNRHVVGSGPFWGYCIFDNHEECDVFPVYRDPVHDFGILRFDPKAVKYQSGTELTLRPDLAKVGVEIRIVGNDAGEKLSIHSGVISRLDRNAPETQGYTDFNTNYIQAATSMVGGSSGSPVINVDGFVIAIQAAGNTDAATDFFLPLDRPLRALECIRKGQPVARGDIQVQWTIKPFDECRRLGLSEEWEKKVRQELPKETGMLVSELVVPEGPGDSKIDEGDVLLQVNGELVTQLIRLDDIMDSSVHGKVKLLVQRGGEDVEVEVDVGDLHAITPSRFVTVAGATFHDLSYQQARTHVVSLKNPGVFCCAATGSFRFEVGQGTGWLIQTIDNKPTPDLDTFIDVIKVVPDRSRVIVTAKQIRDMHTLDTSVAFIDRHWNRHMRLATRNDVTGFWDFTDLAEPLAPIIPVPMKAKFTEMEGAKHRAAADVVRSFVKVSANMPIKIDGNDKSKKVSFGLVIDAEKGLVVVSRATVPYDMCDITVTIADSIIVDGKVIFMHPLQNYAIIQYDPSLVLAPVQSAKLATKPMKQGEETIFVGFNVQHRPVVTQTTVTDITTVTIPASGVPRYRAVNVDAITVDTGLGGGCGSGVLVAEDGTVQALWLTYLGDRQANHSQWTLGLATPALLPAIDEIKSGGTPNLRILNLETQSVPMSQCRIMGVSEKWIERVESEDRGRHHLFLVRKVDAGFFGGLLEGDIILTLNDNLITRVAGLDVMYNHTTLRAVIVRRQEEIELDVSTVPTSELETNRVVIFCGAVLQPPHHAVRQQISKVHSDIYISGCIPGSPAEMYKLAPTCFIMAVNGVPTKDLTAFVRETAKIPNNTYFRLKMRTFDNVPWVATMKKCEHYFPTVEFFKDANVREGWRRITYEDGEVKRGEGELMPEGASAEAEMVGA